MKQQQDKQIQYDKLQAMHIFEIWERDLDTFVEVLRKVEELEERDRLAIGSVANEGKKKRKPAAAGKKNAGKNAGKEDSGKKGAGGGKQATIRQVLNKKTVQAPSQTQTQSVVDENDLPLMERLKKRNAAGTGVAHYPTATILSEMTQSERNALQAGTRKRKASISSNGDDNKPRMQRRNLGAAINDEDSEVKQASGQKKKPQMKQNKKRLVMDSDEEEESIDLDSSFSDDDMIGGDDDSI